MKKLIIGFSTLLMAVSAQAAYQVYDVKLTLTTTKNVTISLPYPLNMYFYGSTLFRTKTKENLTGMAVCWDSDALSDPSLVYLKSSLTKKTYVGGNNVDGNLSWVACPYSRLSPKDTTVETCISVGIHDGTDYYQLSCAGVGKVKTMKYKRWWRSGTYSVPCVDTFKGYVAGTKSAQYSVGLMMDGETENNDASSSVAGETAVYGTWTIKFNKKYSSALYTLSTRNNTYYHGGSSSGGAVPCSDEGDDEGEELSVSEISSALGL